MVTRIGARRPRQLFLGEWREKRGLTQQQLADRVGTTKESVSRGENGKRQMNVAILAEMADALGIDVPDLFFSPDKPSPSELLRAMPRETVQAAEDFLAIAGRKTGT